MDNQDFNRMPESWVIAFRRTLMIIGGIYVFVGVVHVLAYFGSPVTASNPYAGLMFPIITSFIYAVLCIPYLLVNAVYVILWAVKVRGRELNLSRGSTACLILAPIFVFLVAAGFITLIYMPPSML